MGQKERFGVVIRPRAHGIISAPSHGRSRVRRGWLNRSKPRRIQSSGRTAALPYLTGVVTAMMVLVVAIVLAMIMPLVMSMVVTLVGMPMVMFMAVVVVLMLVVIAHEVRS
jgi:hypothetical protein